MCCPAKSDKDNYCEERKNRLTAGLTLCALLTLSGLSKAGVVSSIDAGSSMDAMFFDANGDKVQKSVIPIAPSNTPDVNGSFGSTYSNHSPAGSSNADGSYVNATLSLNTNGFSWSPTVVASTLRGESVETIYFTTSVDSRITVQDLGSALGANDFADFLVDGGDYEYYIQGDGTLLDTNPFVLTAGEHFITLDYVGQPDNGVGLGNYNVVLTAVPEPASLSVIAIGAVGLLGRRKRA